MNSLLPSEISHIIESAFEAMQTHPNHLLLPFYRHTIYKGIDKATGPKAHKIKAVLSILTAQHVIPYWKIPLFMVKKDEDDYDYWLHIPNHLVEMAKGIINGTIERKQTLKEVNHLIEVNDLTGQMDDSPYYHEWCTFEAALNCVREALSLDFWKTLEPDERVADTTANEELEWYPDTAMFACLAYAGGSWTPANPDKWTFDKQQDRWITQDKEWYFEDYGIWNRNTQIAIARRQKFWEWWLDQAISEAWLPPPNSALDD